ncbi:putative minor extracellular protease vpr protein [Phaeoacremonium minimum UCRPA7]|uniref:Putative minor extracellular protease vpr protein n=1 Tax=Phaeoacremonium minimum (strain UCR-PA7) TaxID=1286976 RepID=R8BLC5_PHAM7|nr:putative minor extracellular protease vpr protein [Phaeoacremonium minimum UCRPA7]EOO00127.1 putative minor extracellular protease vpr protein [Phaeoacremonium minimum UCRPA7]
MAKWTLALKTVAAACVLACPGASAWSQEQINASRRPATAVAGPAVPGKFIVELQAGAQTSQRDIASRATTLLGDMRIKGYEVEIKTDYSMVSGRFQGVSVQIANNKNASINDIKGIPGVADVWPVYAIALDDTIDTTDPSPQWNPHITTRVDELHKRGFTGEGQRVCVVDSGVDATHPALSGRIVGGKNLIEDNDNFEDCMGHGTFVSSVILGSTKDLTGVAPRAEVFMYKVFACENSVSDDLLLKGLLAADADDCDIVSVSIGSETGYSGSILSRMASEISKDRLVIIAAGNSGETGTFYASSPASGRGVISVASTNAKQVLGWPALIVSSSGETFNLSYVTPDGAKLNESVVAPITFDAGDSCNPEQYGSEEQALIVKRGICFPQGSYNELSSTGFGYYLIFDSYNQGVFYVDDVDNYNPSVHLFALTDASVGEWVKAQIAEQYNLTLEIEVDADTAAFASDRPSAGQVSYFSSWGPSFENDFSPSVAAPGGAVYGAFPDNTYAVGSGTSFSAPYVAGVAALYYAHVKKDHSEFARRLSSTAALLPAYDDTNVEVVGTIAPLIQQGAGLIDAVKVFDYQTVLLSDRQISLNDTDNRVNTHTISLQNAGSEAITYKISHSIAATVQSRDEDLYPYVYYPPLLADVEGSIEAPDSVTIPAGSTQDVIVTFHSPMSSDNSSGVVWSGKVVFQGENDETLAVPYMGVQASTYNWTPLEGSPLVFRYDDVSGYLYPVDWESKPYKPAELSSPEIYFALRYGTYEFSMDLVGEDYTTDDFAYPLTAGPASNQWRGPVRTQPDVYGYYTDFPTKFPIRFSNVGFNTFQSFSNGTEIPSGRYRILSRALRVFGDGSNPQDWQLFLSDPFSIQLNDDPIPGVTSSTISSSTAAPTFTEATSSVQLPTSEPVTTTSAPITSATSVPGITTTLKAFAQPTGLAGAFVDLSLYRQNTEESHDLFDTNSWLEIHVQISIPTRLYEGTTVSFALPQVFVDVAESKYVQSTSALVGTALFDSETSVFTVTFNDWVTWHDNIVGDFYLSCRLNPDFQTEMMAGTYFVEMETVGKTFLEPLYYRAIDRSRVYESVREVESDDGSQLFAFVVEVPGSVGPWTSVTLISSQSSGDDGFRCELTHVNLGMTFDDSNRVVDSTDVTNQTVRRCEVKEFRAIYSSSIETHELQHRLGLKSAGIKPNQQRGPKLVKPPSYRKSVIVNRAHLIKHRVA